MGRMKKSDKEHGLKMDRLYATINNVQLTKQPAVVVLSNESEAPTILNIIRQADLTVEALDDYNHKKAYRIIPNDIEYGKDTTIDNSSLGSNEKSDQDFFNNLSENLL